MLNHGPIISSFRKYIFHAEVNVEKIIEVPVVTINFSDVENNVPEVQVPTLERRSSFRSWNSYNFSW